IALLDIGQRKGALRKMFVAREYRGMPWAAGQQLLDTLLYWAKEKKFGEIYLGTTAKFLAAHRFYEKNGFAAINKETLPGGFPMMEVDVKFYKRSV
ncbi:MAG TPA: GNAT family N-acetyltransferase, partial [Ferruginibacter sp.]|nr:GNAT family N-acetyltransferase [Ferruginibacter sp.]